MKNLTFIIVCLILVSCNELPLGQQEIEERGNFDAINVELQRFNTLTFSDQSPELGSSLNLVLGRNNEYESRILLKFSLGDTAFQGLDEIKMILTHNDDFRNDSLRFSIHLLDASFTEYEANWLQRSNEDWWQNAGGDFTEDSICMARSTKDSLIVYFNYLQFEKMQESDGVILIPRENGFVHFYSRQSGISPQFIIKKNEEVLTMPIQSDCHIIEGPEPFYVESWIGTGIPIRNYAKFVFDSTLIDKKALYGELTFTIEDRFVKRDSVEIAVRELLEPVDDFETVTGPLISLDRVSSTDSVMSIDIVKHIQRIIEHPDSNFGFFVIMSPEDYDISQFKIRSGSHRLNVGYIPPPEER